MLLGVELNDIANVIAITALIPVGMFIYYYGTTAAPGKWYRRKYSNLWRSTSIGKVLMYQKISWFLFLLFVLSSIFFDYPGREVVRVLAYSALVAQFWVVFHTLRKLQKSPPTSTGGVPVITLPDNEETQDESSRQK